MIQGEYYFNAFMMLEKVTEISGIAAKDSPDAETIAVLGNMMASKIHAI